MEDRLEKVIKKIILPHYPTVMKFKIKKESNREYKYNFTFDRPIYKNVTTYVVEYYFDTYSDLKEYSEGLDDETNNLFDMLGPDDNETLEVLFFHNT